MGCADTRFHRLVEIHLLVFDAFPESFHEHVVAPAAFPVHADLDAVLLSAVP
jgi:hypothetical protein